MTCHQNGSPLRLSGWLFALLCCLSGVALGQDQATSSAVQTDVVKSFDRFRNLTTLQADTSLPQVNEKYSHFIYSDSSLAASFLCKGDTEECSPASVTIRFDFESRLWMFQNADIIFLIDGMPLTFPSPNRLTSVSGPRMSELLSIEIPTATFRKIARAHTAEVQIGTIDFPLSDINKGALKAVVARLISSPEPPKRLQPAKKSQ